ncbi:MAG: class I SAM-dependent methyltransferase [Polyangiaceae bacterium]
MMEQEKLWDHIQTKDASKFEGSTARLSFLVSKTPRFGKVVDIGVGGGQFEVAALAAGRDVYAVDASDGTIRRISVELGLGDKARVGVVEAIPFADDFFDCAVMSEVLEHLDDEVLESGLREVRRVLKKGGLFVGTVPAREVLAESMVYCPTCNSTFHRWGHVRTFSVESMQATLSTHFRVREVREKLFLNWEQLNWRGKVVGGLQVARTLLGDVPRSGNIVFVAAKV